jgi:hypothetical protein
VRIIDDAVTSCRPDELAISWNVQGRTGPSNAFKKERQTNIPIPNFGVTPDGVDIITLSLPAGSYVVNAVVTTSIGGGDVTNPTIVQCFFRGGISPLRFRMTFFGQSSSFVVDESMPITTTFTLTSPNNVTVACGRLGFGEIVAISATINAIQVATLTTQ